MKLTNILFLLLSVIYTSCSDDRDVSSDEYTVDDKIQQLSSQLFNTSWTYQYSEFYTDNGRYSDSDYEFANIFTFTFSNEIFRDNYYKLIVNGRSDLPGSWRIDEDGVTYGGMPAGRYFGISMTDTQERRWLMRGGSVIGGNISTHTNSKLIIKDFYSDGVDYVQHIFTASSNPSGGSGGGSVSYEKPDIGFYDFTATKSSLKVQYKIYNSSEADISSAKVYYGTSNNPSTYKTAIVSGTLITANITGLKSGTTYYVKCEVAGKGGKTITSVTKCITNY